MPPGTIADQTPLCNDMVVAADGTVYVTDTLSGRILRLKKGASALETWATDPRWDAKGPQLNGDPSRWQYLCQHLRGRRAVSH
jgi:hypothetical protein